MPNRVALITDSVAGLPPDNAAELGIRVVPASFAFEDERMLDGALPLAQLYARIARDGSPPRTFGPTERAFRSAFDAALEHTQSIVCLVTPFDVSPAFTTACAAMLAIQDERPDASIKVINPGVGSAGLASLLVTLACGVAAGWDAEEVARAVEAWEPRCDTAFVPADAVWLERAGRLHLLEERLGALDGDIPVLRVGTRLTAATRAVTHEAALQKAIESVGIRAGTGTPLNVTVVHTGAVGLAEEAADRMRRAYPVENLFVGDLTATVGSQLGPGTVGIGAAPAFVPGGQ